MRYILLAPALAVLLIGGAAFAQTDFKQLYDDLLVKFNTLEKENQFLKNTVDRLKDDKQDKNKRISQLQEKVQNMKERNNELREENDELLDKIDRAGDNMIDVSNQLLQLAGRVHDDIPKPVQAPIVKSNDFPGTAAVVNVGKGTSVPGCEETYTCHIPYNVTIKVGERVTWVNNDAAHTVTSGDLKKSADMVGLKDPNGFDSGMFMSGNTFSHVFRVAGEYPYFCTIHPWKTGIVSVQ